MFVGTANTRDMNGTALASLPFEAVFRDPEASQRFQGHLPIQVQSCWNGLAILDPAPMYSRSHVRFRMARLYEGECSDSDVSLLSNDYWCVRGRPIHLDLALHRLANSKILSQCAILAGKPATVGFSWCRA